MAESMIDWRDFLVPIIVCLICYWLGGKWGKPAEKRKNEDILHEKWMARNSFLSSSQLAELMERGVATREQAIAYLVWMGFSEQDSSLLLGLAIRQLVEQREKSKRG